MKKKTKFFFDQKNRELNLFASISILLTQQIKCDREERGEREEREREEREREERERERESSSSLDFGFKKLKILFCFF